mmetsp:Transcript_37563/g.82649  ORF Transcript_37563/g.82649 Transcript_37563/m.82649 type:complete len:218 (+) Transcript_37563:310-963(+)
MARGARRTRSLSGSGPTHLQLLGAVRAPWRVCHLRCAPPERQQRRRGGAAEPAAAAALLRYVAMGRRRRRPVWRRRPFRRARGPAGWWGCAAAAAGHRRGRPPPDTRLGRGCDRRDESLPLLLFCPSCGAACWRRHLPDLARDLGGRGVPVLLGAGGGAGADGRAHACDRAPRDARLCDGQRRRLRRVCEHAHRGADVAATRGHAAARLLPPGIHLS